MAPKFIESIGELNIMPLKRVASLGLNLRSGPTSSAENVITTLHLAHEVSVVDEASTGSWSKVDTRVDGTTLEGFVASRFLRRPEAPPIERLLQAGVAEWLRFEEGGGPEDQEPFFRFIGEMWQALGLNLDGRSVDQRGRRIPWSAAFISFLMRNAGYDSFRFSSSHAVYIRDAIRQRREGNSDAPFWGFRLTEQQPQLGDLVCGWRNNRRVTFDTVPDTGFFPSHCDVVVRKRPRSVLAMGGNVSDSVKVKTFSLDDNGFLRSDNPGQRSLFAILRNNMSVV